MGQRSMGFSSLTTQSVGLKHSKLPTMSMGRGASVELPGLPTRNAFVPAYVWSARGDYQQESRGQLKHP